MFEEFFSKLHIMILSILVMIHERPRFSVFTSRLPSLLVSDRGFCFSLWYLCFCPVNYHQHRPETNMTLSFPIPPYFVGPS
jgi:hypothetical protein